MKTKLFICVALGLFQVAQAEYVYDINPPLPCWSGEGLIDYSSFDEPSDPAYFSESQCNNDKSTAEKNFFIAHAEDELKKINDVFNAKLQDIEDENQAGAETLTSQVTALYRTYEQCVSKLCSQITRDCLQSKAFGGEDVLTCDARMETLSETYLKFGLPALVEKNLHTKKTALFTEHLNALSYNFDKLLHPRFIEANKQLEKATKSILALAKQLWTQ